MFPLKLTTQDELFTAGFAEVDGIKVGFTNMFSEFNHDKVVILPAEVIARIPELREAYIAASEAYRQACWAAQESLNRGASVEVVNSMHLYDPYKVYRKTRFKHFKRSSDGYVYLIKSQFDAYYKIGRAVNPEKRMRTFNVKLPFKVEFVCVIKTEDMYALETELHRRFKAKHIEGEWFALDAADVEYIKSLAQEG